jgi:hypothetical protein
MNKNLSKKTAVSAAVSATVVTAPAINPADVKVWETMGREAAIRDTQDEAALAVARVILKDAPYATWIAFGKAFMDGAKETHRNPENLLHRVIYAPLAGEGIKRPVSPTSSNARVVSDAAKAVAEAKAASAKALVEMDDADLAKETSAGKADPARMAALWGEMQRRAKEVTKAAAKVEREAKSKARKAVVEVIDSLTVAEMQKVQTFASALVAKRK